MYARANRVGNCMHVDFGEIMATIADIKGKLQREKALAEQSNPSIAELIATK